MDILNKLNDVPALYFALGMIIFGLIFGVLWYTDHKTHLQIWKKDISDGELRTHRMILYASYGLMFSLLLMAWVPWIALPLFIGCWVTRTLHETLDEMFWHLPRCTEFETIVHLGMWICIHAGTAITFIWGFFFQYRGFGDLPWYLHACFVIIFLSYSYIGHHEIFDYKGKSRT
tara:strand:+ start:40561 stop:41082 length:522 start_codon:yes stop_codon:yes gene_type:complete